MWVAGELSCRWVLGPHHTLIAPIAGFTTVVDSHGALTRSFTQLAHHRVHQPTEWRAWKGDAGGLSGTGCALSKPPSPHSVSVNSVFVSTGIRVYGCLWVCLCALIPFVGEGRIVYVCLSVRVCVCVCLHVSFFCFD